MSDIGLDGGRGAARDRAAAYDAHAVAPSAAVSMTAAGPTERLARATRERDIDDLLGVGSVVAAPGSPAAIELGEAARHS
jgi:hypothetical protein